MADLNEVRLIGRLTRDPELKSTPSGQYVCSMSLATSRKYKGQDGVFREDTTFVDITCWGKLAELVARYLKKGRQVFVGGRLKFDSWDDKQSGQKRSKLTVVAENVQFLDRKDSTEPVDGQPAPAAGNWPADDVPPSWGDPAMEEPPF